MILFIMHCLQKDICIVFEPFPKEIVANFVDSKFGLARDQLCHFTHYMHCLWMLSQRIFAIFVDLAPIGWARDQYVTPLIIWIVFKHCLKEILPFCRSSSDWLSTWPSTLDGVGFFAKICMHDQQEQFLYYACMISRNNFYFNYLQSTWPSTWTGVRLSSFKDMHD